MEHNQIVSSVGRRITDTYTLPNNYRIKITTYHDKIRKTYFSYIAERVIRGGDNGVYFEYSRPQLDLHRHLSTANGLRYNAKDLHAVHAVALELGAELRDQHLAINADYTAAELAGELSLI